MLRSKTFDELLSITGSLGVWIMLESYLRLVCVIIVFEFESIGSQNSEKSML